MQYTFDDHREQHLEAMDAFARQIVGESRSSSARRTLRDSFPNGIVIDESGSRPTVFFRLRHRDYRHEMAC